MLLFGRQHCIRLGSIANFHTLRVPAEFNDVRLDRFLNINFDLSKALTQKLLRTKKVCIFGKEQETKGKIPPGFRLNENDVVQVNSELKLRVDKFQDITKTDLELIEELKSNIQYKSETLLIIDKPSGVAVQGGTNTTRYIDKVLSALKFDCPETPRIVHRLDKGTSGLLILARTRQAAIELTRQFRENQIKKEYLAIVTGSTGTDNGIIDRGISRVTSSSHDYRTVHGDLQNTSPLSNTATSPIQTQSAITEYQVIAKSNQNPCLSLLRLSPHTGRKHQLRVHCAQVLYTPILGDLKYGKGSPKGLVCDAENPPRLFLHMHKLTLPNDTNPIVINAPLPKHFLRVLDDHFDGQSFTLE
ncbi:hypothetical protein K7432_001238 [Basidiobolus ranarum]|uniref:21S rRNA pseudouridine(2819) synthase n=1 Tax=Basidiobolus ranarum TaxID=34480 RepID=A0ABR2X3B8_9FUNG